VTRCEWKAGTEVAAQGRKWVTHDTASPPPRNPGSPAGAVVIDSREAGATSVPKAARVPLLQRGFRDMHELSIALALVDLACEERERLGRVRVEALHLRLGALAGVAKDALAFSFDVAAEGTPIEGARLEIEDVPITVFCSSCGAERAIASPQHMHCPVCAAPAADVRGGRELQLAALEVAEDVAANR
jgi:hydrogenase nickel incorporation protein HypA/HybF